jgi:hypothetical protein
MTAEINFYRDLAYVFGGAAVGGGAARVWATVTRFP